MKVVILCGGKGERLREYTETIPKPLVEIGGQPILWHIMKMYSHYGFNQFILCLGYKGEKIKEALSQNKENWDIEFVDTGLDTNTGGRIKKIQRYIETDFFFLTYGDGVSDINMRELLEYHQKHGKIATVTCTRLRSLYGIVNLDENNSVVDINEKPFIDRWINSGFFVFNKKIFNYLDETSILEDKPLKQLSNDQELMGFKYNGFWQSMDTYKDTRMLNEMHAIGKAKWMVWENNAKT